MKKLLCAIALVTLLPGCSTIRTSPRAGNAIITNRNAPYGLTFTLPPDWHGYTVLTNEWLGQQSDRNTGDIIRTERGPEILLRNPQWTESHPRQDIPIRVFTRAQWNDVHDELVWTSAGGIDFEISHNRNYVFGVHSRFNWSELPGSGEAQKIVATNSMANGPTLYEE